MELSLYLSFYEKMFSATKGKANQKPTHCSQYYWDGESQERRQNFQH